MKIQCTFTTGLRNRAGLVALTALLAGATTPAAAATPLTGIGIDEKLSGEPTLGNALNQAQVWGEGLALYARIVASPADFGTAEARRFEALDERVDRYTLRKIGIVLALTGPLPSADSTDEWRNLLRALAERYKGKIQAYEIGEIAWGAAKPAVRDYAFGIKQSAVTLRAADADAIVIQGSLGTADVAWQSSLYAEDVAAYVDGVALRADAEEVKPAIDGLTAVLAKEDPSATIVLTGRQLPADPRPAAESLIEWQLSHLGAPPAMTTYDATPAGVAVALRAAERVKDLIAATELLPLDAANTGLKLTVAGQDASSKISHSLLYNAGNYGMYLLYRSGASGGGPLEVEIQDATGRKPVVRDALTGRVAPPESFKWDPAAGVTRVRVPVANHMLVLDFAFGTDAQASRADVVESAMPSVAEIVFKHQQVQAAQDAIIDSYTASAKMETHFRTSATDPGYDLVTENRFFHDREGSEWEELTFVLNGSKWGAKRPPFPLLQPEKVLSLPLDLRLSKDYRYKLDGVEKVEGRDAYAVRFDPIDQARSLYSGTMWIDTKTFARVKVQAVQHQLSAPVKSNEEIQFYGEVATPDGRAVSLMTRFNTRQIMLIAGRNILVERIVQLADVQVNPDDFEQRRELARRGVGIMYRDTDKGLRYFVKKGEERVVEENPTTTATALALGMQVDPSFDYPLPLGGINHLDFAFVDKNTQLSVLFAGVLALANVQRPKLFGNDDLDASMDLFAIAVTSNDQVFGTTGELADERLKTRPFNTGVNLGWQFTPFQKLIGSYQFAFNGYSRDDLTAVDFEKPKSTITNGVGLGYEHRRGGYSFQMSGTHFMRGSWTPWGRSGDLFSSDARTYDRFSVSLSKDLFFKSIHKVHLNTAYFGGRRLDRFSSYQFGLFDDNKIHGVPSSGVRFAELAMIRAGYSFNLFDLYRLDLFLDQAIGRRPRVVDTPRDWEPITGLGLGFNLRAPFGTLMRGEIGKSFLPDSYKGSGSITGQILILKPL